MKRGFAGTLVAALVMAMGAGAVFGQTFPEPTVPAEWQSKTAAQLLSLGQTLAAGGEEKAADRGLLAQYVGYRFLKDAAQTRTVTLVQWDSFTVALAKDAAEAVKGGWRTALRSAFAADAAAVCALSDEDFGRMLSGLRRLGDTAIPGLWAQRVSGKYLTDAATTRAVSVEQWRRHVANSKDGLSEAERSEWQGKLTAAFIPTPAAMAAMGDEEFTQLGYLLRSLVPATSIPTLVITRLTARDMTTAASVKAVGLEELLRRTSTYSRMMTEEMKTLWRTRLREAYAADGASLAALSEEEFAALLSILNAMKDTGIPEVKLSRLTAKYLGNVAAMRTLTLKEWGDQLRVCQAVMSEEAKTQWIASLRSAFADEATLAGLSEDDFRQLTWTLTGLGDKETKSLTVSRTTLNAMPDAATARTKTLAEWHGVTSRVSDGMTDEAKALWIGRLREAFAADAAAVAALGEEDFAHLTSILNALGDKEVALLELTRVTSRDLTTPEAVRQRGLEQWKADAIKFTKKMSEETRAQWIAALRAAYAADAESLAALGEEDFMRLTGVLTTLNDPNVASLSASRIKSLSMGSVEAVRAAGLKTWNSRVQSCASALSEADRQTWITTLRSAFAPDAAALAALSDEDFGLLMGALSTLKDTEVRSLIPARLGAMHLSDPQAMRAMGAEKWRYLTSVYSSLLTDEQRAQWLTGLRAAFVTDAATFAALSVNDFNSLSSALRSVGEENTDGLSVSWVTASNGWQTADGGQLTAIARSLGRAGSSGAAARKKVSDSLASQTLSDAAKTATVTLEQWDLMSRELSGDMSAETKAAWASGLRSAFAGGQEALGQLTSSQYGQLVLTLERLGDVTTPVLSASWMAASEAWQTLDLTALRGLGMRLSKLGQDGQGARDQLADQLTARLTADPVAARAMGCPAWTSFARYFTKDAVTAEKRTALATALRAVFAGNAGVLANLKAGDFQQLVLALKALGDTKTDELSKQWMEASEAWKSGNLSWFLQALPKSGAEALDARKSLVAQVEAQHLANADAIRAVGPATWLSIVREVKLVLTPAASTKWAKALRPALLQDGAGSELSTEEFIAVSQVLQALGDSGIQAPAQTWLADHEEEFAEFKTADLAAVVSVAAGKSSTTELTSLMTKIDTAWTAKLAAGEATAEDCRYLSRAWCAAGKHGKGVEWALKMYDKVLGSEAARTEADASTLNLLVGTMHTTGMLDFNDQEYSGFAQVAARLAREGKLDSLGGWAAYKHWGMLLTAPTSRQMLEAELVDPEGNPRAEVAKIVGWSYQETGQKASWREFLDGKLQAASEGDQRARWLLVRAYAQSVDVGYDCPSPLEGRTWLEQALAGATSADMRFAALAELVRGHSVLGAHDVGLALLDSVAEQFDGTTVTAQVEALREEIREAKVAFKNRLCDLRLPALESLVDNLAERIDAAQARGDTDAVTSLQAQLAKIQAERDHVAQWTVSAD